MLIIDQRLTCDLCGAEMSVLHQTIQPGAAVQHITRGPIGVTQWHDVCAACSVSLLQAITDLTKKTIKSDPEALIRIGAMVRARLNANPMVQRVAANGAELYVIFNFLTPLECEMVIKKIDEIARPSPLYGPSVDQDHRTSFSSDFPVEDEFINMLQIRTDDLLGIEKGYGERLQGQRYEVGQQFKSHMDWFWPNTQYYQMEMDRGGQRSWTAMTYLNEVEEGGATAFRELDLIFKPEPGMLLMWNNATLEGEPNKMVLHSGEPVIKGVKYVTTKWYREREWN